ncbi:expressed unknown protein [Seminavis robusta]|uniref:Uncharacterized protein n=1 Tax=Seminavis robusta TaxID=568900 RepID=A0A9N8EVN0_9STRA|nr:expressed unknown protein [Seminavis robusta]|eukprot:Sro1819_g299690.1 n/a (208) ;mRNA; r:16654-17277
MDNLHNLNLRLYWNSDLVEAIASHMQRKLKYLRITIEPTVPSPNLNRDYFAPILETIKTSSLEKFQLIEIPYRRMAEAYQHAMVEILKSNYTLETAYICSKSPYERRSQKSKKREIEYYTTLNQNGRALVGNPEAPLVEIVNNLAQAAQRSERVNSSWTSAIPVLYGLLREAPGKWIGSTLGADCDKPRRRTLKRKFSRFLERFWGA